uniref:DNA-directed RNA polymerase RpoA/D/Rpb3-type domain-containing protein n=1 Tax=viral metagenome TaxID=1070528 RepID=A0A6C0HTF5_9ZZZZ
MSITLFNEDENNASFRFQGHLSIANAIRRTVLNDIDTWVFITSPNEENQAVFHTNTTRMNNELLKQRLSCIPIHVKYLNSKTDLTNYYLEVNVQNTEDTILQVTTKDFIVKHKETNEVLEEEIFPPFISEEGERHYITFIVLRPQISAEISGEKIHFTCAFSVGNARMNAMFNVVSNCSYGNTIDKDLCRQVLIKKKEEWEMTMSKEEVEKQVDNWWLLDAKRIFIPDSFDFTMETLGVFTNREIIIKACLFILESLRKLSLSVESDDVNLDIKKSLTTIPNAWDIVFIDDYTIGKMLEYSFTKTDVTYCGYIKLHPHDEQSTLRIAFKKEVMFDDLIEKIISAIEENIDLFNNLGNGLIGQKK